MASLGDRSFNITAYGRMTAVAVGLLAVLAAAGGAVWWYERNVEAERVLRDRFRDPQGEAGIATARVAKLGEQAVPVLAEDLKASDPQRRYKAMEMLGAIDDPRVVPTLAELLKDPDIGVRLSGMAALARTGRAEAFAKLMPLTQSTEDLERWRAIVALGLVATPSEYPQLEGAIGKANGLDRTLFGWALGHAQRRQESLKAGHRGIVLAAPAPVDEADSIRIMAKLAEINADLASGKDLRATSKQLAELTDISFSGWDVGHHIALQVMAVGGPAQWRAAQVPDELKAPTGVILKGEGRGKTETP